MRNGVVCEVARQDVLMLDVAAGQDAKWPNCIALWMSCEKSQPESGHSLSSFFCLLLLLLLKEAGRYVLAMAHCRLTLLSLVALLGICLPESICSRLLGFLRLCPACLLACSLACFPACLFRLSVVVGFLHRRLRFSPSLLLTHLRTRNDTHEPVMSFRSFLSLLLTSLLLCLTSVLFFSSSIGLVVFSLDRTVVLSLVGLVASWCLRKELEVYRNVCRYTNQPFVHQPFAQ